MLDLLRRTREAAANARRLLWLGLALPPALGAILLVAYHRGLLSADVAVGVAVTVTWIAALVFAAYSGRRLEEVAGAGERLSAQERQSATDGLEASAALASSQLQLARASGENEDRFRRIADAAPVFLWTVDGYGQCTFVNHAWLAFTGRTLQQELGSGWMENADPEAQKVLSAVFHEGLRRRQPYHFEWRACRHDGEYRWVAAWHSPLYSIAGEYLGAAGAGMDVTERQIAAEELRRVNQELFEINRELEMRVQRRTKDVEAANRRLREVIEHKSEFLASMSHELRTPLNGIIGFAELIHDGKAGPTTDTQREYLQDVLASGQHLLRLVSGVLDLAAIEAGKIQFNPETVDLADLVDTVRDAIRPTADQQGVSISTVIDPAIGEVCTDPTRMKQVLFNYLSNAVKHTPSGGVITVRAVLEQDSFRVDVEDMGPGIQDNDIPRLFKDFEQIRSGGGRASAGTGLGLALTRRLVEAQGGSVGLRTAVGKGSTFYARFPLKSPVRAA